MCSPEDVFKVSSGTDGISISIVGFVATSPKGLYLSGAATYPGAGIVGISGRNAAYVVSRAIKGRDRLRKSK